MMMYSFSDTVMITIKQVRSRMAARREREYYNIIRARIPIHTRCKTIEERPTTTRPVRWNDDQWNFRRELHHEKIEKPNYQQQ